MSLFVDPPFALGQTLGVTSATEGENWVGVVKVFPDVNPRTGVVRSNRVKTCIAVRNSSGVTLLGKRGVVFAPGNDTSTPPVKPQSRVSGYLREAGEANPQVAGVSDEYLPPAGVANNDVFWVTVEGPTEMFLNHAANPGDRITGVTAHTTNSTVAAGTGGYGSTQTITAALTASFRPVYFGVAAATYDATAATAGRARVILGKL